MIKAKPLTLAQKLKNIVDICEAADSAIDAQNLIKKGALDAGKENDGIEPGVVRKILARRKRIAKDPAETTRLEDLMTDYQFMLGEGREDARPWTQVDDEVSRVMALTNTGRPPKIEAIKKALGCSQGKAHKLRSIAAVRLSKKSSSSLPAREHEHLPEHDSETGEIEETPGAVPAGDGTGTADVTSSPAPAVAITESCGGVEGHAGRLLAPKCQSGVSEQLPPDETHKDRKTAGTPAMAASGTAGVESGPQDHSSEASQEVGTGDPRPKGTPEIDLTIPPFLKRERVSP